MDSMKDNPAGPDVFSDDDGGTGGSVAPAPRRRWPWVAAIAVAGAAAVTAAMLVGSNLAGAPAPAGTAAGAPTAPASSAAPAVTPSPAPSVSRPPSAAATASSPPAAATASPPPADEWRTFTSSNGKASFEHPATWTVAPPQGAAGAGGGDVDVDVSDETGTVVASLHLGPYGGLGGACQGPVPYAVLDVLEVDLPYLPSKGSVTPRFAFRALQQADRVTASYGLTSTLAGQDGTTCMFYNVVNGPAEVPMYSFADAFQVTTGGTEEAAGRKGAKSFPSLEAARAYMESAEYRNAKRMITSLKITAGQ